MKRQTVHDLESAFRRCLKNPVPSTAHLRAAFIRGGWTPESASTATGMHPAFFGRLMRGQRLALSLRRGMAAIASLPNRKA